MSVRAGPSDWRPRIEALISGIGSGRQLILPAQDAHILDRLSQFLHALVHWNQRMDLTAARTPDELVDLFIADAVVLAATTPRSTHPQRWVDVGSGAGAPAIPLAVLRPDLELTLVEPKAKRVAFLRTALGVLSLERVQVQRVRSSDLPDASFEVACSRATLTPEDWLREGARLANSVWVLLARGATPVLPGWRAVEAHDYEWPLTRAPRRALRFAKG